jgi:hypothetical protein
MFKLAMGRLPEDGALCSQPSISRLENLPDKRTPLRMGYAMVELPPCAAPDRARC